MKKVFLSASLALLFGVATAQEYGHGYLVKTKNVEKKAPQSDSLSGEVTEQESSRDFLSLNFPFKSLCDWTPGMEFMVLPERYDLVVRTFHDAATNREVSSGPLRYHIMVYQGHDVSSEQRHRINFLCKDNNRRYYYEIPNGTFEDYCYGKMGVPTLAYLGDVDKARELLLGKTLYTKGKVYRIDTASESEGYREVIIDDYDEVVVKNVGVGSRSFPVKIIVAGADSVEYYQNVAMSKINSGMRDDEFVMDSLKHTFYGAFEMEDGLTEILKDYNDYVGKTVHTRHVTPMTTKGDGKERTVKVPKMTSFTIEALNTYQHSGLFTLTLKESESRRVYFKDVSFDHRDNVIGAIDGKEEEYFGYLFAMGEGKARKTTSAARAAIREGRVIRGMTEDEVTLAMGEAPAEIVRKENNTYDWIYYRSKSDFVVSFNRRGIVEVHEARPTKRVTTAKKSGAKKSTAQKTSAQRKK